ncbi:MAG TPA: endonuclease domain-containing protein [Panacibacter sp.]|nr:endonuclease domain-containing protein [Panacibacter sp.]
MEQNESYNNNLHKYAKGKIFENARALRQNSTEAEEMLWQEIRNKKLNGLKFRRQHPIDKWIADFYCHEKKLVIELDGLIHNEKEIAEYDAGREKDLNELGMNVIRFRNEEVMTNIESVLKSIAEFCKRL